MRDARMPSQVTDDFWCWVTAEGPGREWSPPVEGEDAPGKWLVFVYPDQLDTWWSAICGAVERGELGPEAKAATMRENPQASNDRAKVIVVYTRNWRDTDDVARVLGGRHPARGPRPAARPRPPPAPLGRPAHALPTHLHGIHGDYQTAQAAQLAAAITRTENRAAANRAGATPGAATTTSSSPAAAAARAALQTHLAQLATRRRTDSQPNQPHDTPPADGRYPPANQAERPAQPHLTAR